jgi:hypothetical protein
MPGTADIMWRILRLCVNEMDGEPDGSQGKSTPWSAATCRRFAQRNDGDLLKEVCRDVGRQD